KGTSQTMQRDPEYINLISEVMITLKRSIETAEACGVDPQKIIIDPGIGFGKTVEHNLELIRNIRKIKVLHKPVMVGCSRKNFIGKILGIDNPRERLMGSATAAVIAIINGADIVRVHDVREMAQVVRFVDAAYPAFYKS
ncbi:MAG: dihydropteroate synthase, partial [Candidatus Omnitrophota bacterium]